MPQNSPIGEYHIPLWKMGRSEVGDGCWDVGDYQGGVSLAIRWNRRPWLGGFTRFRPPPILSHKQWRVLLPPEVSIELPTSVRKVEEKELSGGMFLLFSALSTSSCKRKTKIYKCRLQVVLQKNRINRTNGHVDTSRVGPQWKCCGKPTTAYVDIDYLQKGSGFSNHNRSIGYI